MGATRMISVIGRKQAGKTTLLAALGSELTRRKFRVMTLQDPPQDADPIALARRDLQGADIVLVEGFERAPLPKIEVHRLTAGPAPLFNPAAHNPADWVAILTDNPAYRAPFPVFRFSDTAWLVSLANLAWDRAKILPP